MQKLLLAILMLVGLVGCLEMKTVVKIKPNGSGTIEMTVLMNKSVSQGLQGMVPQQPGQEEAAPGFFDENKLKEKAGQMGTGVQFVSAKKLDTETQEGFLAVYSFADISQVKLNQNPGDVMPSGPMGAPMPPKTEEITFQMQPGNPATLTIHLPAHHNSPPNDNVMPPMPGNGEPNEMQAQLMQQIFADMKIAIYLQIDGTIQSTNATYRDNATIVLLEMDFGKLIADPEKFRLFAKGNPQSIEEAKKIMQTIPGIRAELNEQVTVVFN